MDSVDKLIRRRASAEQRIIDALAHIDRNRAMSIIMGFIPVTELEELADFQERKN